MKKRCISFALVIGSMLTFLTGCGNNESDFSITVKSIHGKLLENVSVEIYSGSEKVATKKTNSEGICYFNNERDEYSVKLSNLPSGYYLEKEFKTNSNDSNYEITCLSKVIESSKPNSSVYKEGDLMYDFSVNNTEDETIQLSKLFDKYDMVMLNFFYIDCYYCNQEFPFLEEAYNDYKDDIAVVALSNRDTASNIKKYKANKEYSFDFAYDDNDITTKYFNVTGFPTSVIIDRYGIITEIHEGAIVTKEDFTNIFEKYIGDNYSPNKVTNDGDSEEITDVKPTETMPSSSEIEKVINGEGFNYSWYPEQDEKTKEYSWPFLIDNEKQAIYSSNSKVSNSSASIYTKVHLKENEVFTFDYFISSEEYGDYLYVVVDGDIIEYSVSGVSIDWTKCYAFIANEEKDYEIGLHYIKDSDSYTGEDKVYIRNVKIISNNDISESIYIKRHASSSFNVQTRRNESFVSIFYNENDNYYHVNSINGPLLFADISGEKTTYFDSSSINNMISEELFDFGEKKYNSIMSNYATWAYNNDLGVVPVTKELKDILYEFTTYYYFKSYSSEENFTPYENQWLDICCYYEGYNQNGIEMEDPIKGLATFSSYEAKEGDQNFVTIEKFTMPRGVFSKFVPTKSGVYKINSVSNNDTVAWVYLNDNRDDIFFESDTGARVYQTGELSTSNYCMYIYLEEGTPYYICSGFDDMYKTGTIQFNVEYIGDSYELFTSCSYGPFVSENEDMSGSIISLGIKIGLASDGYYHELDSNNKPTGSIVYCDFEYVSYFNYTINDAINNGWFNLSYDQEEETEIEGGKDYTNIMKLYQNKIIKNEGMTKGCVPVDETLAKVLYEYMNVYTFNGVKNSWLKLCYYYKNIHA